MPGDSVPPAPVSTQPAIGCLAGTGRSAPTVAEQPANFAEASAAELVCAARSGSQRAWNELVDRFSPLLWHVARRIRLNRADAADAVQASWLRLIENLDRIRNPGAVPGWLVTTCHREALRIARAAARCSPAQTTGPAALPEHQRQGPRVPDPVEVLLGKETAEILRAAVSELPDHQRRLLAAFTNTSGPDRYHQVSKALDIPVGSIGPTRNRALRNLRNNPRLRPALYDDE